MPHAGIDGVEQCFGMLFHLAFGNVDPLILVVGLLIGPHVFVLGIELLPSVLNDARLRSLPSQTPTGHATLELDAKLSAVAGT